ncbi:unnamed protein product [Calicophoron daubneyi]|uniref:EF-hand domain-containing protein n=1 Tax=Calicophoron daubneyi TaxID=300641 RepID=A0AAV2TH20_CALDB
MENDARCSRTPKEYPTNRVFACKPYTLSNELLRGIVLHHPLTHCSGAEDLKNHINQRKSKDGLISYRKNDEDTYYYNLPVGDKGIPSFISEATCGGKKPSYRLSLDEVDLIIRGEIARRRNAIKCLFQENQAEEESAVPRGALLNIISSLCPNVTIDLFHRLLERYKLDRTRLISFRQFEEAFTAQPLGHRKPPSIFRGLGELRCLSVAQAFKILQEIACDPKFDLKEVLPPSCFEANGRILCPQLREALNRMRIYLTDENFRRLWHDKLDIEKVGSIRTSQLCQLLSLKDDGTPIGIVAKVTPLQAAKAKGVPKLNRDPRILTPPKWLPFDMDSVDGKSGGQIRLAQEKPGAGGPSFPLPPHSTWTPKGAGGSMEPDFGCGDSGLRRIGTLDRHEPCFVDIMDCLRYRFETPYQAMLVSFGSCDPKHELRVSARDCNCVLREYGLPVSLENQDAFLKRILSPSETTGACLGRDKPIGVDSTALDFVTVRPGQVPYKRMLDFYQDRSQGSIAYRIMQSLSTRVPGDTKKKVDSLTATEVEEELVKLLHKNFMRFVQDLKLGGCANKKNVIDELSFRLTVNRVLGFLMSDEQWEKLKEKLVYAEPGCVNWKHFLNYFNHPAHVAPILSSKKFDASQFHCPLPKEIYRGEMRDIPTLLRLVENTIRNRLHHIDASYKHFDHKALNMLCKEDFHELLAAQGLELLPSEMNYIWGLLDSIEPGKELHNYRQVMNYFFNRTRPIITELLRQKRNKKIHDPNLEKLKEWRKNFRKLREAQQSDVYRAGRIAPRTCPRPRAPPKPTEERLKNLANRITSGVTDNWEQLQEAFFDADRSGSKRILWDKFKCIAKKFSFDLNDSELDELCRGFDAPEKDYFAYVEFMNYFSKLVPKEQPPKTRFDERLHQFTNTKNGEKISFTDLIAEIRKACYSRWRTLQEAFRKLDEKHTGEISIGKIDDVLRTRNIALSKDDLYHLLAGYDRTMTGRIGYDDFRRLTLKAFKPVGTA